MRISCALLAAWLLFLRSVTCRAVVYELRFKDFTGENAAGINYSSCQTQTVPRLGDQRKPFAAPGKNNVSAISSVQIG